LGLLDSPLREFPFRLLPHFQHPAEDLERTLLWEERSASSLRLRPIGIKITGEDRGASDLTRASVAIQSIPASESREIGEEPDYTLVVEAGTVLHPSALYILTKKIGETGAKLIYWDEALYRPSGGRLVGYERKARPSNISFAGRNVPGTSALVHRSLLEASPSLWRTSIRCGERDCVHVPLALSSRLEDQQAKHEPPDADLLRDRGLEIREITVRDTALGVRSRIELEPVEGELGVIIPFRDQSELTLKALASLSKQSVAPRLHVRLVDNNSAADERLKIEGALGNLPFATKLVISDQGYFNFARLNNVGFQSLPVEFIGAIVLMNNDVEISGATHLEQLLAWSHVPGAGLAGGTLTYPGGRVQSAGINFSQVRPMNVSTPAMLSDALREVDGLTFALVLIRTEVFESLGGLDETHCPNGFGDALFCHEADKRGFRSLHIPWLEAVHHESASRGARPEELELLEMTEQGLPIADLWSDLSAQRQPMFIPLTHSSSAFHSIVRHVSASPRLLRIAEGISQPILKTGRVLRKILP